MTGQKGKVTNGRGTGGELGGVERAGEAVIRIECMRKETIFNKRGKTHFRRAYISLQFFNLCVTKRTGVWGSTW